MVEAPGPELVLRVNGCQVPMLTGFGSDSPRNRYLRMAPFREANASCSVLVRDPNSGRVLLHLLFDVGLGVVASLEANRLALAPLLPDAVFLTHSHYDHCVEVNHLALSMRTAQRERGEPFRPLPVYCTDPCARLVFGERGLFPWTVVPGSGYGSTAVPPQVEHVSITPCEPVRFRASGAAISVTPVSVYHHVSAPGAVIYVVEGLGKKVVIGWDLVRLVEAPDTPNDTELRAVVSALPAEFSGLIRDADVMLLDSTFWHPRPSLGHICIQEGLALAQRWRPKRLYWAHYGSDAPAGREAPLNPTVEFPELTIARALTDPELRWLAGYVARSLEMDVRVAYLGMTLPDTEPWPVAWPPAFT